MIDKAKLLKIIDERSDECFKPEQNEFNIGYARALFHLKRDIIRGELVLPQAIKPTESPSEAVAESEVYGNDCKNDSCS